MSRIDDGFSTLITLANVPAIKLYEKEVTPPGVSGGGANDTTTMRNTTWRTMSPKKLKSLTPMKLTAAYDTVCYNDIIAQVNINQLITVKFADNSTLAFWGYLNEFTPGGAKEGEQPTAEVSIEPTNQNASGVETAPIYTPAP
jgi:hypothetical protein